MQEEQFIHIDKYGNTRYYADKAMEIFHRLDGPAIEYSDSSKSWYVNGKLHRLDGPAIEYSKGYKAWYVNDTRHRLDGPAIEYSDGYKEWYVDGQYFTEAEFINFTSPKPVELTLDQIAVRLGVCVDNLKIVK